MQPGQPEELGVIAEIGLKIAGVFLAFVSGIVSTTWVISSKLSGYENRISSVEKAQAKCQGSTLTQIDAKIDKIHSRIDEILLALSEKW